LRLISFSKRAPRNRSLRNAERGIPARRHPEGPSVKAGMVRLRGEAKIKR
jgi:hypothetical protein